MGEQKEYKKQYLGDGAYAQDDGEYIMLTAENGISVHDRVHLDPEVLRSFFKFVADSRSLQITVTKGAVQEHYGSL